MGIIDKEAELGQSASSCGDLPELEKYVSSGSCLVDWFFLLSSKKVH